MLEGIGDEKVETLHCTVPALWVLEVCKLWGKLTPSLVMCVRGGGCVCTVCVCVSHGMGIPLPPHTNDCPVQEVCQHEAM